MDSINKAKEIIINIIKLASQEAQKLEDKEALEVSFLYPDYKTNQDYKVGDKFLYNNTWSPADHPDGWKLIKGGD